MLPLENSRRESSWWSRNQRFQISAASQSSTDSCSDKCFCGNLRELRQSRDVLKFLAQAFARGKSFRIRHQPRAHGAHGRILGAPFLNGETGSAAE